MDFNILLKNKGDKFNVTVTDNRGISSSCGYLKQVNKTGSFDSVFSFTTGEV